MGRWLEIIQHGMQKKKNVSEGFSMRVLCFQLWYAVPRQGKGWTLPVSAFQVFAFLSWFFSVSWFEKIWKDFLCFFHFTPKRKSLTYHWEETSVFSTKHRNKVSRSNNNHGCLVPLATCSGPIVLCCQNLRGFIIPFTVPSTQVDPALYKQLKPSKMFQFVEFWTKHKDLHLRKRHGVLKRLDKHQFRITHFRTKRDPPVYTNSRGIRKAVRIRIQCGQSANLKIAIKFRTHARFSIKSTTRLRPGCRHADRPLRQYQGHAGTRQTRQLGAAEVLRGGHHQQPDHRPRLDPSRRCHVRERGPDPVRPGWLPDVPAHDHTLAKLPVWRRKHKHNRSAIFLSPYIFVAWFITLPPTQGALQLSTARKMENSLLLHCAVLLHQVWTPSLVTVVSIFFALQHAEVMLRSRTLCGWGVKTHPMQVDPALFKQTTPSENPLI